MNDSITIQKALQLLQEDGLLVEYSGPQDLLQKLIFLRPAFFQFLPDPCRFLYLKTVFRQRFLFYLLFSFDLITHGIVHLSFSIINGILLFVKFCSSISYITELFFP